MQKNMEALLLGARVNMVLNGHVHAYERSHPVAYNKTDTVRGITYLNIGDGGNREGHSSHYLVRRHACSPLALCSLPSLSSLAALGARPTYAAPSPPSQPTPAWSAYHNGADFGHGKVKLINATHAKWSWIVNNGDAQVHHIATPDVDSVSNSCCSP